MSYTDIDLAHYMLEGATAGTSEAWKKYMEQSTGKEKIETALAARLAEVLGLRVWEIASDLDITDYLALPTYWPLVSVVEAGLSYHKGRLQLDVLFINKDGKEAGYQFGSDVFDMSPLKALVNYIKLHPREPKVISLLKETRIGDML